MLNLEQCSVVSLNPRWTYYKQFRKEKIDCSVSGWCINLCDLDNPGFPKYKAAVGTGGGGIFLYDSDGVLSFDSLRGVNCIFSLT